MDLTNLREVVGDVLRVFLGGVFLWYGYFDLRPSESRKAEFRRWGFGPAVQPTGGVLQLASVALLIVPATVTFGATLLLAMMLFSAYVHLAREYQPRQALWPLVLGGLAVVAAFLYGAVAWGLAGALFRAAFG